MSANKDTLCRAYITTGDGVVLCGQERDYYLHDRPDKAGSKGTAFHDYVPPQRSTEATNGDVSRIFDGALAAAYIAFMRSRYVEGHVSRSISNNEEYVTIRNLTSSQIQVGLYDAIQAYEAAKR